MKFYADCRDDLLNKGFTVIENVFTVDEIKLIINFIDEIDKNKQTFRKTADLFAIRRFLKEIPEVKNLVFNYRCKLIIKEIFGDDYFVVKSIYFDKPEGSNWFVAWHQDLTISVDKKVHVSGYGPWTVKPGQFAVQPPVELAKNNFTMRIHLDDTDEENGALKVLCGTQNDICRQGELDLQNTVTKSCNIKSGGVMIMRPLLMHASNRTINNKRRRVVHIEFSNSVLPDKIAWSEKEIIF